MKYETLRLTLNDRGISIRGLALKAGIVPQSLNSAMNEQIPFWPGWRKRVAEALNMSEAELFDEDGTDE